MNIRVLGAFEAKVRAAPSAFLVNDRTLVDAGSVAGGIPFPNSLHPADLPHARPSRPRGSAAFLYETFATCDVQRAVTLAGFPRSSTRRTASSNNSSGRLQHSSARCPARRVQALDAGTPYHFVG